MNAEFQELKNKVLRQEEERNEIIDLMKKNLKKRNGSESLYTFTYTSQGKTYDIDKCDVHQLFEIDGDLVNRED